jgi:hypothetical protein
MAISQNPRSVNPAQLTKAGALALACQPSTFEPALDSGTQGWYKGQERRKANIMIFNEKLAHIGNPSRSAIFQEKRVIS